MANQMIALGVRGPQLPNLAGAAAQYGNMMANMATMREKQAGIQRANAFRQLVSDPGFDPTNPEHIKAAQSLDPAGAEKIVSAADARRKANLEYVGQLTQQFRDQLAVIDPSDKAGYGALREEIVAAIPGWGSRLPTAEQWGPDARVRTLMKADDVISKTIATPTASVQVSRTGTLQSVTVGGLGEPSAKEIPEYRYVPDQPPAPATGATTPPATGALSADQAAPILRGASESQTISPEDADRVRRSMGPGGQKQFDQWMRNNNIQITPMSFGGEGMGAGAIQPLTMESAPQIIQTAIQNGVIDQSHVEQLRQMVGPENDQALANWMRQNNISIQPTGGMAMRSAVYRQPQVDYFNNPGVADDGMPFGGPTNPLRQNIGYEATGRAAQAKPPLQSPMPGSASVPLPRVQGESAAGTAGSEGVKVKTQPLITAGEERAKRIEKLRGDIPKAYESTNSLLDNIDERINAIDAFLRNPYRRSIIGSIEGRIPKFLQDEERADAQALWDTITGNDVMENLIAIRGRTETGASPLGPASDADVRLIMQAANSLTQRGTEAKQEQEMLRLRDKMIRARNRAIQAYGNTYREVSGEDKRFSLNPRPISPTYRAQPQGGQRTKGGATVSNW